MTLARVKTWVPGDTLTAADLNAEFNNILNNPTALITPLTATLNFARNQATNLVLENLGVNPATSSPGRVYYNTVSKQVMLDDGTGIHAVGPLTGTTSGIGSGSYVRGLSGSVSTNVASFNASVYAFQTTDLLNTFIMGPAVSANVPLAIDFQTAGPVAGGRDKAAAFASKQVHLYAITTGANSTSPAGICSTNPPVTGPVMPSSYVGVAYLCSLVYSTASSAAAIPVQRIQGSRTYLVTTSNFAGAGQGNGAGVPVLTLAADEVETSVLVNNIVPILAPYILMAHVGTGGVTSAGGTALRVESVLEADFSVPIQTAATRIEGVTSGRLYQENGVVPIPNINTPPSFVYYNIATTGFGTPQLTMNVLGYTNDNGGEA